MIISEEQYKKLPPNLQAHFSMGNTHCTVKPTSLMQYLCRLTKTPSGGTVLDPFMGSGTTGIAALKEDRKFIGIELDEKYFNIAKGRIQKAIE